MRIPAPKSPQEARALWYISTDHGNAFAEGLEDDQ
jgi:hypothetical protein